MARIIYPINDKRYTAEDVEVFNCTRTSGVYAVLDFDCSLSGDTLTIGKGLAWIKNGEFSGKTVAFTEPETLTLEYADDTYDRYDVVAIRYDATKKEPELIIKKGVASASPEMPTRSTETYLYELYLYSILREKGEPFPLFANITDLRRDKNYCGIMRDSVTSVADVMREVLYEDETGAGQFEIISAYGMTLEPEEYGSLIATVKSGDVSVDMPLYKVNTTSRTFIFAGETKTPSNGTFTVELQPVSGGFSVETVVQNLETLPQNAKIIKLVGIPEESQGYVAVDDLYNPESHNAQSGEAVKQAIDEALEKFTGDSTNNQTKRRYNTFSVLGDSYSTFVDFVTPNTNECWYPAGNPNASGSNNDVSKIEQMWWYIFATEYKSALQVNNSYSGSPICYDGWGTGNTDSIETGFIARAKNIGTPELIFVLGGTNDDWVNATIGEYKYADWTEDDFVSFRPSLAYLLNYLKQHNAGAKIVFILNENLNTEIDTSVLTICAHYDVDVLELQNITVSNKHPTIAGQASIAQQVIEYMESGADLEIEWTTIEYTEEGGYYNYEGIFTSSDIVANTGLVGVGEATQVKFTASVAKQHNVVFFDVDKKHISTDITTDAGTHIINIPVNASFFSVAYYIEERDTVNICVRNY